MAKCFKCGLCREKCPTYKALRRETVSPRGIATLTDFGVDDKAIYICTMCGACKVNCPALVDIKFEEARINLVNNGVETAANSKIAENIRRTGNPYGIEGADERSKED